MRTMTLLALVQLHPEVFAVEAIANPRFHYNRVEYRVKPEYTVNINRVQVTGMNYYKPTKDGAPEYFYISAFNHNDGSCYINPTEDVDVAVTKVAEIV